MDELIWVGNTLYPRWFVFGAPIVAILLLAAAAYLVWRICR